MQQLGERSDISAAAIHKIERNGMVPTITTLMKLAVALKLLPIVILVGTVLGAGEPHPPYGALSRDENATLARFLKTTVLARRLLAEAAE